MNTNKVIILCWTASFALSGFAQTVRGATDAEKQTATSHVSASPVRIWLADLKVKGERWTGGDFLRGEKFGEFECKVVNQDCHDQQARRKGVVRWNQTREELLQKGDTNKASVYVETPLPTFPPCALKIDRAVTNWMLNPSVKIYRVAGIKEGKRVRGEGWPVDELGGKSALWPDGAGALPDLLEGSPFILCGKLDKAVTDKLENGEYELEVSLDTAKATGLNVANTGVIACRFVFRIKSPETDSEKWWLARPVVLEAEGRSDWTTVLSLTEEALKKYTSSISVKIECLMHRGNALRNVDKDEEALVTYDEALKIGGRNLPYNIDASIRESLYSLRRRLKEKENKNVAP